MTYSDGNIYEGEWEEDNRHGFGSFTWANGDRYVGHYKQDVEYGEGMFKKDKEFFMKETLQEVYLKEKELWNG